MNALVQIRGKVRDDVWGKGALSRAYSLAGKADKYIKLYIINLYVLRL